MLVFCLQALLNQAVWITFAPITAETASVFQVQDSWVRGRRGTF